MNWLDFGRDPPNVKGQRSMNLVYICYFPPVNTKSQIPWVDFHQTWYRGAPLGVDELIRFWARSTQCQRSRVNELGLICYFYLVNAKSQEPLGGFSSNDMAINYLYLEWDCIAGGGGGSPRPPPPPQLNFVFLRDNSSITWWNSIRLGWKKQLTD